MGALYLCIHLALFPSVLFYYKHEVVVIVFV